MKLPLNHNLLDWTCVHCVTVMGDCGRTSEKKCCYSQVGRLWHESGTLFVNKIINWIGEQQQDLVDSVSFGKDTCREFPHFTRQLKSNCGRDDYVKTSHVLHSENLLDPEFHVWAKVSTHSYLWFLRPVRSLAVSPQRCTTPNNFH